MAWHSTIEWATVPLIFLLSRLHLGCSTWLDSQPHPFSLSELLHCKGQCGRWSIQPFSSRDRVPWRCQQRSATWLTTIHTSFPCLYIRILTVPPWSRMSIWTPFYIPLLLQDKPRKVVTLSFLWNNVCKIFLSIYFSAYWLWFKNFHGSLLLIPVDLSLGEFNISTQAFQETRKNWNNM